MKNRNLYFFLGLCMAGVVSFTSCSDDDNGSEIRYMLPQTEKVSLTPLEQDLVDRNNEFAIELLQAAYARQQSGPNRSKSFCISPFGTSALLNMAGNGAEGATKEEIMTVLKQGQVNLADVNNLYEKLLDDAPDTDEQVQLEMANGIYLTKHLPMEGAFSEVMDEYYDADARTLDFSKPEALNSVNRWFKDETDGAIPSMLDKVNESDVSYLLNANYFKAKWTNQFDKAQTKVENFTNEDGTVTQVPMMSAKVRLWTFNLNIAASIMRLPYGSGSSWSMYVIEPAINPIFNATLESTINGMSNEEWKQAFSEKIDAQLNLKIPKFSTSSMVDMKSVVQSMGVNKMFTTQAEMTKLCPKEGTYIQHMWQKCRIDVDEEGAGKTAVTMDGLPEQEKPTTPPELEGDWFVNSSFLYLICEESTGAIFLAGVYQGN